MGLTEVVKLVESCEMGKSAGDQISKAGGVFRLSEHQRGKFAKKVGKASGKPGESGGAGKKCGYCGRETHPRDQCPARDKECRKCKAKALATLGTCASQLRRRRLQRWSLRRRLQLKLILG